MEETMSAYRFLQEKFLGKKPTGSLIMIFRLSTDDAVLSAGLM
jgi:hypothetical protein